MIATFDEIPAIFFVGFHAVDLDSASVNDLFIPSQVRERLSFVLLEHQKGNICTVVFCINERNVVIEKLCMVEMVS